MASHQRFNELARMFYAALRGTNRLLNDNHVYSRTSGARDTVVVNNFQRAGMALQMMSRLAHYAEDIKRGPWNKLVTDALPTPPAKHYAEAKFLLNVLRQNSSSQSEYELLVGFARWSIAVEIGHQLQLTALSTAEPDDNPLELAVPFNTLEYVYSGEWLYDVFHVDPLMFCLLPDYEKATAKLEARWNEQHTALAQLLGQVASDYGVSPADVQTSTIPDFEILRNAIQQDIDALSAQEARWRLYATYMRTGRSKTGLPPEHVSTTLARAMGVTYDLYSEGDLTALALNNAFLLKRG